MTHDPAPRFVLLRHVTRDGTHWDFMLESGPALATWRLPRPLDPADPAPMPAERIGDHRLDYLDYEGPLTRDRGHVTREDRGPFNTLRRTDAEWEVDLAGARLRGRFRLAAADPAAQRWTLRSLRNAGPSDSIPN